MGCRWFFNFILLLLELLLLLVVLPVFLVIVVVIWLVVGAFTCCCIPCNRDVNPKLKPAEDTDERVKGQIMGEEIHSVCIVGGGIAGLQMARNLRNQGKSVKVFEKADNVGGVWRKNYADYALQVPGELFEFPEFPFKHAGLWNMDGNFPDGKKVQGYIEKFYEFERLQKIVQCNTTVVRVENLEPEPSENTGAGWNVTVMDNKSGEKRSEQFDFVIIATGMYSNPNFPKLPGHEKFKGQMMHSSTYWTEGISKGKKVIVVGGGKSAIDIAVASSRASIRTTLLPRSAHWPVPRFLFGFVPFKFATYSRFGHSFLPLYMNSSLFHKILNSVGYPAVWLFWRFVEQLIVVQFNLQPAQMPRYRVERDLFTGGAILSYDWRRILLNDGADLLPGAIDHFYEGGVVLKSGKKLDCDQVIFATGFCKDYSYIVDKNGEQTVENMKEDDGYWLFQQMVHPDLPNIVWIGSEVSTFCNILTHAMQSEWLIRILSGQMRLPSEEAQREWIERNKKWKRSWMPPTKSRSAILQLHMFKYHDDLVSACGESPYRKITTGCCGPVNPMNYVKEWFGPYEPRDYVTMVRPPVPIAVRGVMEREELEFDPEALSMKPVSPSPSPSVDGDAYAPITTL